MFDANRIRQATGIEHVEVHQQLDSTNDRALELIRQNAKCAPGLIVAEQQMAGRGQRHRKWWSGTGSLTFTWIAPIVDTSRELDHRIGLLPVAAALAVADAVELQTELREIKVKWPNDLLVAGRKLCGILIETVSIGSDKAIVVGIGINVNHEKLTRREIDALNEPSTTSGEPTSVLMETNGRTSLEDLLLAVLKRLEREFELTFSDPLSIADRGNRRLAFQGQEIDVVSPSGKTIRGTCVGITTDGGLALKSDNGDSTIYSGSISGV